MAATTTQTEASVPATTLATVQTESGVVDGVAGAGNTGSVIPLVFE